MLDSGGGVVASLRRMLAAGNGAGASARSSPQFIAAAPFPGLRSRRCLIESHIVRSRTEGA